MSRDPRTAASAMAPSRKTLPLHRRVAVVFDFDDTLGPDSTGTVLRSLGQEPDDFWPGVKARVREGWDPVPAQLFELRALSRTRPPGERVTRDRLVELGRTLRLFDGVDRLFGRLEEAARSADARLSLETYLLSSGLGEVIRATTIAGRFTRLWATELHWDAAGELDFPRRIISHTEKTRYLDRISKGLLDEAATGQAFAEGIEVPAEELHVPLSQVVYVGDGLTDLPCFAMIEREGGVALGVHKPGKAEKWGERDAFRAEHRVANLARADYGPGSELLDSLLLAVESVGKRVALRQRSHGQ